MSPHLGQESLLVLISEIYDAAIDAGRWTDFLHRFGALSSTLHGEFDADELRVYQSLLPHLERARRIHQRLVRAEGTAHGLAATLDLLPMGVLILDGSGRVIHRNRFGASLNRHRTGLWVDQDGRPRSRLRHEDNALRGLIGDAIATHPLRTGGSVAIHANDSPSPLHVLVSRLAALPEYAEGAGRAIVFFTDPGADPHTSERHLGQLFGFTPAQAGLVTALVAGESMSGYADRIGINIETARSHLIQAFAKAGVRRQQELIARVLRSPMAVAPPGQGQ